MWLLELIVQGLLEWMFQRRLQWIWIPIGAGVAAVGVIVASDSRTAGILIAMVGGLALVWGVLGGLLGRGDE